MDYKDVLRNLAQPKNGPESERLAGRVNGLLDTVNDTGVGLTYWAGYVVLFFLLAVPFVWLPLPKAFWNAFPAWGLFTFPLIFNWLTGYRFMKLWMKVATN